MNDPNKRIDVNISSLLSLKAELLRKREEVNKAKQTTEPFVPKKSYKPDKNTKTKTGNQETNDKKPEAIEEYEDSALIEKSRKVLEAKSRFYDKMTKSGGSLNSDDNCLVLFNQKQQEEKSERRNSETNSSSSSSDDDDDGKDDHNNDNPNEEWVEYTDCLGRTRKCLKKDLEFFKKKDLQLAETIQPRIELNQNAPMWMIDKKCTDSTSSEIRDDISEMTSMMSKHDQMKMNWEKKEEENVYKENVHYQDILFDEARQHGVGYYAFSTDEEERAKQRKALDELREKTLTEQKQKEAQRAHREKIIAERVKAAKNRQRARLGLPPLEDEPESAPEQLYDTKEEEKKKRKEEKERKKKEKEEKLKEKERKKHVRPWDRNKDGVNLTGHNSSDDSDVDEWKYKPQKEPMSQEQWNEMKRNERNMNFAPVPDDKPIRSFRSQLNNNFYTNDNKIETDIVMPPETLYFTTKKPQTDRNNKKHKEFIKRNYSSVNNDERIIEPIKNELNIEYDEDALASKHLNSNKGAEIPPPPTYEYYGPSGSKRSKTVNEKPNLEQSIEAGLRFIRDRADKGILPVKSSWTANASNTDY